MKKFISTFLFVCFSLSAFAVDFDSSIDSNIRKEYNVEESTLPPLPSSTPSSSQTVKSNIQQIPKEYNVTGKTYKVKSGTKVILTSKSTISDWSPRGSKVGFVSQQGFTTKDGTIVPAGTTFRGTITDSHRPQITGNGGLIELKIDEIYFNGIMSPIETKVSMANSRRIFRSDIKGERKYWRNISKAMTPGKKVFGATQTCASVLYPIPVIQILSVVPLTVGAVVYLVNAVAAPVISIFAKGGSVSLPAGTQFQIQTTKEIEIRG